MINDIGETRNIEPFQRKINFFLLKCDGRLVGDENNARSGPDLSSSAVRWQESQEQKISFF